jgi:16S rRNA G966 N2-methylase RsmD
MKFTVKRNMHYDFTGQSYSSVYPNLHRYPATMIPQVGIDILKEFNINKGHLLDPYCGSGSSFVCGLECGISSMTGFDLNPLAILISKVKFTPLDKDKISKERKNLRNRVFELLKDENKIHNLSSPEITNMNFWFSQNVINHLKIIKHFVNKIGDEDIRNLFLLAFSETVRECSYTRNNEFKLYKMRSEDILNFNPDVVSVYFKYFDEITNLYLHFYYPILKNNMKINLYNTAFIPQKKIYDVVLTSPPYGDSRTTVAYGQFSTLSNEWLGINYARKIDSLLMGGTKVNSILSKGILTPFILEISKVDKNVHLM